MANTAMRAPFRKSAEEAEALGRVRAWTRTRFKLPGDATILVAEVSCRLPGCPPLETAVVFWIEGERHQFKVFKPVAAVTDDDLPPAWLKDALRGDDFGCDCC